MPKNQNRHPDANQRDRLENSVSQQVGDVAAFLNTLSPELNHAAELIELPPTHKTSAVLGKMSSDRAAEILQNLGKTARTRLLGLPSSERQTEFRSLRSYLRDTAGGLMTTEFVPVPATSTVNDTLWPIRDVERSRETVYAIYILDPTSRKPLRTASLQRLITGELKAVGASLVAIVTFGALAGSMLPFVLKALRFDPASASVPFVATLVDVSGIVIFFSIALLFLTGNFL